LTRLTRLAAITTIAAVGWARSTVGAATTRTAIAPRTPCPGLVAIDCTVIQREVVAVVDAAAIATIASISSITTGTTVGSWSWGVGSWLSMASRAPIASPVVAQCAAVQRQVIVIAYATAIAASTARISIRAWGTASRSGRSMGRLPTGDGQIIDDYLSPQNIQHTVQRAAVQDGRRTGAADGQIAVDVQVAGDIEVFACTWPRQSMGTLG
jgi:hypothetical protein